ncbi:unnamed protein product, partial [Ranitomeya imitator]
LCFPSLLLRQGHLQTIILLMKCGADPSLIDGEGYNSVHLAVLYQHLPIIAYLIAKGQLRVFYLQNIDGPDVNGMTPLMLSAQKIIGRVVMRSLLSVSMEPTSFLLKLNPSVNLADKIHRNTALHWAVSSGNVNAVDLLLEAGSSLDVQNDKGETPLDLAKETRNRLIIHILTSEANSRSGRSSRALKTLQKYEGKHRVTKRRAALSNPMFTLVTWGPRHRWSLESCLCDSSPATTQRLNSDAAAIGIVVDITAASLNVTVP